MRGVKENFYDTKIRQLEKKEKFWERKVKRKRCEKLKQN